MGLVLWPADGRIYANGLGGEYLMKHYTIILSVIVVTHMEVHRLFTTFPTTSVHIVCCSLNIYLSATPTLDNI